MHMIGSSSYARDDGTDTDVHLSDVGLRLHLPHPSNLSEPFVTGRLEGAGFGAIILVAYADSRSASDGDYTYAETAASCPPPVTPARDGQHVLGAGFSCSRLRALLRGSYDLEYRPGTGRGRHTAGSSPLQLRHRLMYVNQMSCATDGGVRAYMAFYADQSGSFPSSLFLVGDEALVAEGFWFPDTWSFQDRKTVVGLIWNSSRVLRSVGYTGDLSDIKYNYTLVEKAKEHYHSNPVLSKDRNGSFPGNHSCRDFVFHFNLKNPELRVHGSAPPIVQEDRPMPDDVFSRRVAPEVNTQRLLNVSYDLQYTVADVDRRINAEGVYDTLCMVACQVSNGSSDCQVLVTVQFAPVDTGTREHDVGTISSLRMKSDPLFFEALEFVSQGMDLMWQPESMLELSPALFAVVLILQLRHAKKHPEAVPSMSITMLVVLALGYLIPLMLDFEPAIRALQNRFDPVWAWYRTVPNRFPLRVLRALPNAARP
ncbi:uncharacterized protein [Miscanthus floridulus]|uniref:uncharacterized protein n=1 Tax=Miscanthus floridulus TaxID=154761 RepID=UPI003458ED30